MDLRNRLEYAQSSPGMARGEAVLAPPIHEGIGNALKRAYLPRHAEIPSDFARLLDKLR